MRAGGDLVGATRGGELRIDRHVLASVPEKKLRPLTPSSPTPEALHAVDRFDDAAGERVDVVDALLEQLIAALDQSLQLASATQIDVLIGAR